MSGNMDNWQDALELNFAYFHFSDPYQRRKFEAATKPGPMQALKMLMYAELFGQLQSGMLQAWGFCVEPAPSDGPIAIPVHCFMKRPNIDECDRGIISASGWRYERVRIPHADTVIKPITTENSANSLKSKAGRPSTYPAVKIALEQIYSICPAKIGWPAERLLDDFNAVYAECAHEMGLRSLKLAERTLRNHLDRFRQELVKMDRTILPNDSMD